MRSGLSRALTGGVCGGWQAEPGPGLTPILPTACMGLMTEWACSSGWQNGIRTRQCTRTTLGRQTCSGVSPRGRLPERNFTSCCQVAGK